MTEKVTKRPNMDRDGPKIYPDGDLSPNTNLRRSKNTRIDQQKKQNLYLFFWGGPWALFSMGPGDDDEDDDDGQKSAWVWPKSFYQQCQPVGASSVVLALSTQ